MTVLAYVQWVCGVCPDLTPARIITLQSCCRHQSACRFQGNEQSCSHSTSDALQDVCCLGDRTPFATVPLYCIYKHVHRISMFYQYFFQGTSVVVCSVKVHTRCIMHSRDRPIYISETGPPLCPWLSAADTGIQMTFYKPLC